MTSDFQKTILALMDKKGETPLEFFLQTCLLLTSRIYGWVIQIRLLGYRVGLIKSRRLSCGVISVGNIVVGGTGKTPMTVSVSNKLKNLGFYGVVISRGYKGSLTSSAAVAGDGKRVVLTPDEAGDEPAMLASLLKIPVIVGKDRFKAGMLALERFQPQVIVLDDGYQHLALKRDLNLLLLDARAPLGNGYLLPRGRLREPLTAMARAHGIIFTRAEHGLSPLAQVLKKIFEKYQVPVFRTIHAPFVSSISGPLENVPTSGSHEDCFNMLRQKPGLLVSAIADNNHFRSTCKALGVQVAGHIQFGDHHHYQDEDIAHILKAVDSRQAGYVLTTQKDAVKLSRRLSPHVALVVIGVRIQFQERDEEAFTTLLEDSMRAVPSYSPDSFL